MPPPAQNGAFAQNTGRAENSSATDGPQPATSTAKLTLFVCRIDDGGPPPHACKRAQRALRGAGHEFDKVIVGGGRPFGLFTSGRRPKLKQLSGQEKLPVLRIADGTIINGSGSIIAWARSHAPAPQ